MLFDRLIVAAARNPEKHYTYDLERRLGWLETICAPMPDVEVTNIENRFLAHFARDMGARYILRGIRNEADYQYERGMRYVNTDLNPGIMTVFLMPPRHLCEISSSFVKSMIGPDGWEPIVREHVPDVVYDDIASEWSRAGQS